MKGGNALSECYIKSLGKFKCGDTFAFYAKLKDKNTAEPLIIEPDKIKSQVRNNNGVLYAELIVTSHPDETQIGTYLFKAPAIITKNWPPSVLYIDIEIKDNDTVYSSETFSVTIVKDVTKNE